MQELQREEGFGLVEAVVSTFITAVGVLSVATLFMVGTQMQAAARNSSSAIMLVEAELERIRTLATTAPERADGGSLTANVANHFAVRGNTIIRWQITNKPTLCAPVGGIAGAVIECSKDIAVIGFSPNGQSIRPQYNSVLWR
jgi:Tfp pilus assembly protein PilV